MPPDPAPPDGSPALRIVPANEAAWEDIQTVLGTRGTGVICQCQRFKLAPRESFRSFPLEERAARFRVQANFDHPAATTTSGLLAYLDDEPMGWCAVEPRSSYRGLLRVYRVPWLGRSEDKNDDTVWAITCFFIRAGYRHRGFVYQLAGAAAEFARERGARAVEGYPMVTQSGEEVIWDEIFVGTRTVFEAAGFSEVSRPTPRRAVMRIDFR